MGRIRIDYVPENLGVRSWSLDPGRKTGRLFVFLCPVCGTKRNGLCDTQVDGSDTSPALEFLLVHQTCYLGRIAELLKDVWMIINPQKAVD